MKGAETTLRLTGVATEAVEDTTKAEIDDALCPRLTAARTCLGALVGPSQAFDATVDVHLRAGPDGAIKVTLGGTLRDATMRACVRDALLGAHLPRGPAEGRYDVRVEVRAREP